MNATPHRFLIDMNLSMRWVPWLGQRGFEAVHWRSIGPPNAPDRSVLEWAASRDRIVVTADLDFGYLVLRAAECRVSAVLLRLLNPSPEQAGTLMIDAIALHDLALRTGGVLTIDPAGSRHRAHC